MSYEKMMMEHADRMFDAVFNKPEPKAEQKPALDMEALKADAGDMYDVLSMIVDKFDEGLFQDRVVKHKGVQVWLLDELARDLVDRHRSNT